MQMNHIDIPVPDVAATRDFFVEHLDFRHIETKGRDSLSILKDSGGNVLVLSHAKSGAAPADGFHIGFLLDSRAAVDAAYERLKRTGARVANAPNAMRGAWLFYVEAPGPILIEIAHRP
jgi:catechol 2,3-dioxygenase-like lactoylglutathione lyase family enzyme